VIYHEQATEINFMKDEIQRYNDVPVKAYLGKTDYAEADKHGAKSFTVEKASDLVAYLNSQYN
jgi:hypothetical protein